MRSDSRETKWPLGFWNDLNIMDLSIKNHLILWVDRPPMKEERFNNTGGVKDHSSNWDGLVV